MPGIKLSNVVKTFGKTTALKGISVNLKDGEFFVLVGPTGAGKTTTLRVVSGLEKIDSGQIIIGEDDAKDMSPAERDVAFVYQNFSLYPQMTVRKNLEFPLRSPMHREEDAEVIKRVEFVADMLHITPLLDRMPDALSGGEMQRVGIGRAIVRKPQIFLMDEPLSDLDAKLREELRVELRQIQTEIGTTTFYVTHDQIEAMSMGDRIAVLNEGVIHQIGTPTEVYNSPADLFVAGFIGNPKMNLFGCVYRETPKPVLELENGLIKVPLSGEYAKKLAVLPMKEGLTLGIRPESVMVTKQKGERGFEADVLFSEHFGSMNIINLQVGEKLIKSRTRPTEQYETKTKVWVEFDEERMRFFDSRTTKSVMS